MDWNRYVHLQCERTALGIFNEPFNLLSGLFFFVAAIFLARELRSHKTRPFSLKFLVVMVAVVGAGSMTYHSVSRMWAAIFADGLPIMVLALVFVYMMMKHILRLPVLGGLLGLSIFILMNLIFKSHVMHAPDGYISVIPTIIFMVLVSIYMMITNNESSRNFALASSIAFIAVFFRILDNLICKDFPIGTHFIWHGLMAIFFFLVIHELIKRHESYS